LRLRGAHLVPDGVVLALLGIVLVEVDDVHDGLRVLLLLLLRDAILLQHALPFLGEALEGCQWWGDEQGEEEDQDQGPAAYRVFARLVVDAHVGDMHRVGGRGDGRPARRAQHAAHKGGKGALLLCAAREALLCALAAAIAVAVRLGVAGRGRGGGGGVHVGVEGARGT